MLVTGDSGGIVTIQGYVTGDSAGGVSIIQGGHVSSRLKMRTSFHSVDANIFFIFSIQAKENRLRDAAEAGDHESLRRLIEKGADINRLTKWVMYCKVMSLRC